MTNPVPEALTLNPWGGGPVVTGLSEDKLVNSRTLLPTTKMDDPSQRKRVMIATYGAPLHRCYGEQTNNIVVEQTNNIVVALLRGEEAASLASLESQTEKDEAETVLVRTDEAAFIANQKDMAPIAIES